MVRRAAQPEPETPAITPALFKIGKLPDEDDAALIAKAREQEAAKDTEDMLRELHEISVAKAQFNDAQPLGKRYKELRDALTKRLKDGPRYFVHNGRKYVAVSQQAKPIEIDDDELLEILEDEHPELVDKLMPRSADRTAVKQAVATGAINAAELVQFASFGSKAAFVRFIDVDEPEE